LRRDSRTDLEGVEEDTVIRHVDSNETSCLVIVFGLKIKECLGNNLDLRLRLGVKVVEEMLFNEDVFGRLLLDIL